MAKNITVIMPPDSPMSVGKDPQLRQVGDERKREQRQRIKEHGQTEKALHRPAKRQPSADELSHERDDGRPGQKRVIRRLIEAALGQHRFVEQAKA